MSAYGGYSTTSYGAAGGEDGGGFFGGSQFGGSQGAKAVNEESLRPVTIKQIIDAEPAYAGEASFRIDGLDVKQVTFVGMVRSISPQTTNITYRLDDGTGIIEVKQWLDADKQEESRPAFREEEYVRVWGRLKSFSNKRHVGAHVIKPVKDFNEVNYHLLEAVYVHLFFTKGAPGGGSGGGGGNTTNGGANSVGGARDDSDSMFVDGGDDNSNARSLEAKVQGYSAKARKMFEYLNCAPNSGAEGHHINMIASGSGMSVGDVNEAADELLGHGTIYTTLDDETFAILDGY
ncbi:Uu.00g018190.m01.CDS01 [Anthostomella pinea]|uniref:Uu.00g018190.m01.CDS01 n=1 Tax=Anthostomella pinea TaxID=933095 RepID=A0AAI8YQN5_9PEZI|nr:Uu.00g018190.m01.CDS01 [Anthostomella pinea]